MLVNITIIIQTEAVLQLPGPEVQHHHLQPAEAEGRYQVRAQASKNQASLLSSALRTFASSASSEVREEKLLIYILLPN